MAIIGLLSIGAIAGGSYAIKQGRITRKMKNVDQIATLIQAYYNDKQSYPQIASTPDGTPSIFIANEVKNEITSKLIDTKTSSSSLLDALSAYSDGFTFNNEPCSSSGCYAYTRATGSDTSYALCVQLDTTEKIKQSNASGDEGEYCYCVGGSSDYDVTCKATDKSK